MGLEDNINAGIGARRLYRFVPLIGVALAFVVGVVTVAALLSGAPTEQVSK